MRDQQHSARATRAQRVTDLLRAIRLPLAALLAGTFCAALLGAAGQGQGSAQGSVRGGAQGPAQPAPVVLRIGTPHPVASANIFADYYLGLFARLSHPPLTRMGEDGAVAGLSAESWQASADNRTWRFTVRDELYWSDGRRLTADDVRFSIEYTGRHDPNARWLRDTLTQARVEGERTVVLSFSRPYTTLDLELAALNILPRHVWEGVAEPRQAPPPGPDVGCGPFVIQDVDLAAGLIRFRRNPHWRGTPPRVDAVEIHLYKNLDVLALALEKGEVDTFYAYASSYPYAGVERLRDTGRFRVLEKPHLGLVFLGFNLRRAPGSQRGFREALSWAIDYEEILRLDALGFGSVPGRGFVPPSIGGYRPAGELARDLARARRLLAEAGYRDVDGDGWLEDPDGQPLRLGLLIRSEWARLGELIEDYLAEVGLRCELRVRDPAGWVAAKDHYDYDLTITRTTPWGMLMHAGWASGYFDARRSGQGVLHVLEDPRFLDLADRILATSEPASRQALGAELQQYYARELPAIALCWYTVVTPHSEAFSGWRPDPLYGIYNQETMLNVAKGPE